mmetsp:Transcript_20436/g.26424  ORF Transcript_20436/g.26424 Transcript_20436/m.26424 type:complete len:596 (+) Transcript_20436:301-2088(+)|eukprot:CAMPEP_0116065700 /NCGR_PEP_ID=MMETSP0322-20121206/9931_1 /TAXON_ID=163516 /ORGANISM="Leptocylindrus danicus var. apora, Strain B651" /LENGTH=595 /DNA_ID=CAMNT_0003552089 /DNA_START=248 /DNA_END=2035 /DNA_ORIENTATION=+
MSEQRPLVALRDRIEVLSKQLDSMRKERGSVNMQRRDEIRLKLCQNYSEIIRQYPKESEKGSELKGLWVKCFYERINESRGRINRLERARKDSSQDIKAMSKFCDEGITFYNFLAKECADFEGICFSMYVALGDLNRYKLDSKKAEENYRKASQLDPTAGICYNNIAVIHQNNKFYMNSLYYFVRALTSKGVFPNTKTNMRQLFNHAKNLPEKANKNTEFLHNFISMLNPSNDKEETPEASSLMEDFSLLLSSKQLGDFMVTKMSTAMLYFFAERKQKSSSVFLFFETILDQILSTSGDEQKRTIKYLSSVSLFLEFLFQRKELDSVQKHQSFVKKLKQTKDNFSYLNVESGQSSLRTKYLQEHVNLRGCTLFKNDLCSIPYHLICDKVLNDEEATRQRMQLLKDYVNIINVDETLGDMCSENNEAYSYGKEVSPEDTEMREKSDDEAELPSSSGSAVLKAIENTPAFTKEDPSKTINCQLSSNDNGNDEDDEAEDDIVFQPEPVMKATTHYSDGQTTSTPEIRNNCSVPPPPPGFAPLMVQGGVPFVSRNPFLSATNNSMRMDHFLSEKKLEVDDDPMNVIGTLFGASYNPFLG